MNFRIKRDARRHLSLRISVIICVLIALSLDQARAQGPSDKNPQILLAPWTDETVAPKAAEYYSAAVKLYQTAFVAIGKYESALAANNAKSLKLLPVGQTYMAIVQLELLATRLTGWGEPAGYDLQTRCRNLHARLEKVRTAMRNSLAEQIAAGYAQLVARTAKQSKLVDQIQKMIDDGKLDAAEKKYLGPYSELAAMACWYNYQQRISAMRLFDIVQDKLANAIKDENLQLAEKTIAVLRDKTRPDLTKLPAALETAAAQLTSSPEAEFNGKKLAGPKLFTAAIKQWQEAHRAALRTIALHWALTASRGKQAPPDEVVSAYSDFRKQTIAGLAKLVEAEATRAGETDALTLHSAYLDLAAKLGSVTRDAEMMNRLGAAVDKLAAKSTSLAADVAAYHEATDDLLRWRNRNGEAMAKARRPQLNSMPLKAAETSLAPIELPAYVEQLKDQVVDKDAAVLGHFLGSSGEAAASSSPLENMFVHVKPPAFNEAERLEADLLVSAKTPPLTVAAAKVLASVKRGDFIEAGGVGAGVEIVGMIPFFATDTPERRGVIPIGDFGPLATRDLQDPQQHILISVEITPKWIHGDGFFVELK